jgi:hypothetical protein
MDSEDTATLGKIGLLVLAGFGIMCILIVVSNII